MPIAAPPIHWPETFENRGPQEDPAILLGAEAQIAGTRFTVMALRLRDGMRLPDYRPELPEELYDDAGLAGLMGSIEDLTETIAPARVTIAGDHYLLWMVPASEG